MNHIRFNEMVEATLLSLKEKLTGKGEEYSRNGDRLHNFNTAAAFRHKQPESCLLDFMTKHTVSVADCIDDIEKGVYPPLHVMNEKIDDSILYLLILRAMYTERLEKRADAISTACESLKHGKVNVVAPTSQGKTSLRVFDSVKEAEEYFTLHVGSRLSKKRANAIKKAAHTAKPSRGKC
jgi:hypothetical protein